MDINKNLLINKYIEMLKLGLYKILCFRSEQYDNTVLVLADMQGLAPKILDNINQVYSEKPLSKKQIIIDNPIMENLINTLNLGQWSLENYKGKPIYILNKEILKYIQEIPTLNIPYSNFSNKFLEDIDKPLTVWIKFESSGFAKYNWNILKQIIQENPGDAQIGIFVKKENKTDIIKQQFKINTSKKTLQLLQNKFGKKNVALA